MKALEMQEKSGGGIICLLNAETLKNQCTNSRTELAGKLKEYNADIEYIKDAFSNAERKTDVETALIRVWLPKPERNSFILDKLRKARERKETTPENNEWVAENDFLKVIVNQYKMESEAGINLINEYKAMEPFILSEFRQTALGETVQGGACILELELYGEGSISVNDYLKKVRKKYWKALFNNEKFMGKLTENLRREFYNKIVNLQDYDFTLWNIYELKIQMNQSLVKGIEETIISLFETLSTKYHYYNEMSNNIHYYNGWKTNKGYYINKKVVIPLSGFRDLKFSWGGFYPTMYDVVSKLTDIEKCLNYLDGGLTEAVDLKESLKFAEEYGETKNIQLKYFTVTFYKKGTCHITFTNEELLKKFNIFAGRYKNWLPPSYGKKTYNDMTEEEKEVINEFEGESAYNKTMDNSEYFIFDCNNIDMLEEKVV